MSDLESASALERQAHELEKQGDNMQSILLMDSALNIRGRHPCPTPQESHETVLACERLAVKCNTVAVKCFKSDDFETASALLTKALRLTEHSDTGPFANNPEERIRIRGTTLNNLACMERRRGRLERGLQYLRLSVEHGGSHSPATYLNMCAILIQQGKMEEAAACARRAVGLLSFEPASHGVLAMAHHNLAMAIETINPSESHAAYAQALNFAKKDSPNSALVQRIEANLQKFIRSSQFQFHRGAQLDSRPQKAERALLDASVPKGPFPRKTVRRTLGDKASPMSVGEAHPGTSPTAERVKVVLPEIQARASKARPGHNVNSKDELPTPPAQPNIRPPRPKALSDRTKERIAESSEEAVMDSRNVKKKSDVKQISESSRKPALDSASDPPSNNASKPMRSFEPHKPDAPRRTPTPPEVPLAPPRSLKPEGIAPHAPQQGPSVAEKERSIASTPEGSGGRRASYQSGEDKKKDVVETDDAVAQLFGRLVVLLKTEEEFEKKFVSSRRIQCMFRCWAARKRVRLLRDRQRRKERVDLNKHRIAARRIARFLKFAAAKKKMMKAKHGKESHRREIYRVAATKIQRIARGWLVRRYARRLRVYYRKYHSSLRILQCWFRQSLARLTALKIKKAASAAIMKRRKLEAEGQAATTIQRIYRGHLGANLVRESRGEQSAAKERARYTTSANAAGRIQRTFRGFFVRLQWIVRIKRSELQRRRNEAVERRRAAVLSIQSVARGFLTRHRTKTNLKALQDNRQALIVTRQHSAATRIQCAIRNFLARRRHREKRADAALQKKMEKRMFIFDTLERFLWGAISLRRVGARKSALLAALEAAITRSARVIQSAYHQQQAREEVQMRAKVPCEAVSEPTKKEPVTEEPAREVQVQGMVQPTPSAEGNARIIQVKFRQVEAREEMQRKSERAKMLAAEQLLNKAQLAESATAEEGARVIQSAYHQQQAREEVQMRAKVPSEAVSEPTKKEPVTEEPARGVQVPPLSAEGNARIIQIGAREELQRKSKGTQKAAKTETTSEVMGEAVRQPKVVPVREQRYLDADAHRVKKSNSEPEKPAGAPVKKKFSRGSARHALVIQSLFRRLSAAAEVDKRRAEHQHALENQAPQPPLKFDVLQKVTDFLGEDVAKWKMQRDCQRIEAYFLAKQAAIEFVVRKEQATFIAATLIQGLFRVQKAQARVFQMQREISKAEEMRSVMERARWERMLVKVTPVQQFCRYVISVHGFKLRVMKKFASAVTSLVGFYRVILAKTETASRRSSRACVYDDHSVVAHESNHAARMIQSTARRLLLRHVQRKQDSCLPQQVAQERDCAAQIMQRFALRYVPRSQRKQLDLLPIFQERSYAALRTQCMARQRRARLEVHRRRLIREQTRQSKAASEDAESIAAQKIQLNYRVFVAKKEADSRRERQKVTWDKKRAAAERETQEYPFD